ncbi:MAG: HD-GYP domain-containing protein [Candidatus Eisenbacteria bacterium]
MQKHPLAETSLPFRVYYSIVVVAGALLAFFLFPGAGLTDWPLLLWWVAFIVIADLNPIQLPRTNADITVSSTLDYAAIVVLGPVPAAIVEVISTTITQLVIARRSPHKVVFNICLLIVTILAAGSVFVLLGGPEATSLGELILPLGACALVYFVANTGGVSIVVGLVEGLSPWRVWQRSYMWTLTHLVGFVPLGALIVVVFREVGITGVLFFLMPLLLARYSFKLYAEMREVHFDTVRALTSAIDESDPFTRGHSERVTEYSMAIAREMGLGERRIEAIEYAGLLHDMGKIAMQHDILLKPGKLSDKEWEIMRTHPETGARIVSDLHFLKGARDAVLYHHERYDGKGYPAGLAGEGIPIEARIVKVSDAFDAMMSDRPYRNSLGVSAASAELEKGRGTEFDPQIVDVFLILIEKGKFSIAQ